MKEILCWICNNPYYEDEAHRGNLAVHVFVFGDLRTMEMIDISLCDQHGKLFLSRQLEGITWGHGEYTADEVLHERLDTV